MLSSTSAHRGLAIAVALVTVSLAAPAQAQSTGMVKGKVMDLQAQPVEAAKVLIEFSDGMNRKYETKTQQEG